MEIEFGVGFMMVTWGFWGDNVQRNAMPHTTTAQRHIVITKSDIYIYLYKYQIYLCVLVATILKPFSLQNVKKA